MIDYIPILYYFMTFQTIIPQPDGAILIRLHLSVSIQSAIVSICIINYLLMIQHLMAYLAASSTTSNNSEVCMLQNLQMIISTFFTCQSVFMSELSNLSATSYSEKKRNSNRS